MNTEMMKQFDVLDVETLEMVEGGYSGANCMQHMGAFVTAGLAYGFTAGAASVFGVGGIPGAFVGGYVGAVAGGLTCLGGMMTR